MKFLDSVAALSHQIAIQENYNNNDSNRIINELKLELQNLMNFIIDIRNEKYIAAVMSAISAIRSDLN